MTSLGKMIKQARLAKGMTQAELAKKVGYTTPQFIFLIETGRSDLPPGKARKFCTTLGMNIWLVFDELSANACNKIQKEMRL